MTLPDYHCPGCGQLSELILGPTVAFCTNDTNCLVVSWNPSVPISEAPVRVIDVDGLFPEDNR